MTLLHNCSFNHISWDELKIERQVLEKGKYRIRNLSEYNEALVARGRQTKRLDEQAVGH